MFSKLKTRELGAPSSYRQGAPIEVAAVVSTESAARLRPLTVRKCAFCAEEVKPEAIKCKHCGSDLCGEVSSVEEDERRDRWVTSRFGLVVAVLAAILLGSMITAAILQPGREASPGVSERQQAAIAADASSVDAVSRHPTQVPSVTSPITKKGDSARESLAAPKPAEYMDEPPTFSEPFGSNEQIAREGLSRYLSVIHQVDSGSLAAADAIRHYLNSPVVSHQVFVERALAAQAHADRVRANANQSVTLRRYGDALRVQAFQSARVAHGLESYSQTARSNGMNASESSRALLSLVDDLVSAHAAASEAQLARLAHEAVIEDVREAVEESSREWDDS
ncbi:MAG TPA: hypothetical protein VMO26_26405 [Vicinamibacterales bacterium]|nr:hypothetical protein [Vicinamibacterales bacterium]